MRWTRLLIFAVCLVAVLPLSIVLGYGVYHRLDLASGIPQIIRLYIGADFINGAVQPVSASALTSRKGEVVWTGELENEALTEASGLAVGRLNRDVLFSMNDSGHAPRLFAMSLSGADLGSWSVAYEGLHDFEDMAAFSWQGKNYLMIADTGDNFYWRPVLRLILIEEPDINSMTADTVLPVERLIEFSFADGYRDIEAVAVDPEASEVYLLSKRHVPPELFTLPLQAVEGVLTAKPVARVTGIPAPTARDLREDPDFGHYRSVPTAFDIRDRQALVVTYRDAYLFKRKRNESWAEAMVGLPLRVPLPDIYGLESGALGRDRIFVTGERRDQISRMGMYRVDL